MSDRKLITVQLTLTYPRQHALYFPNISGSPLDGSSKEVHTAELCEGKVSVVAILSSVMSEVNGLSLRPNRHSR